MWNMKKLKFVTTLIIGFIVIVPLGTFLHELGHYLVGVFFFEDVVIKKASTLYGQYRYTNHEKTAYLLSTIGGPMSTLLISLVGIYSIRKSSFRKVSVERIELKSLLKILFAFFISREVLISLQLILSGGNSNADEFKIPSLLNIDYQVFNLLLFLLSTTICFYILSKSVKKSSWSLFLISAIIGCGIGYFIWIIWL